MRTGENGDSCKWRLLPPVPYILFCMRTLRQPTEVLAVRVTRDLREAFENAANLHERTVANEMRVAVTRHLSETARELMNDEREAGNLAPSRPAILMIQSCECLPRCSMRCSMWHR